MVYKNLNLGLTKCENHLKSFSLKQNGFLPARHLCNDLEVVTEAMFPEIKAVKRLLIDDYGAEGALMSGSGPTVFGLFSDDQKAKNAFRSLSQYKEKFLAGMIINIF